MKRPKRKTIPVWVKGEVLARQEYACAHCRKGLGSDPVQFDHRPALWVRPYNSKDFVPGQLDPLFIEALHWHCHKARTFGTKHRRQGADITEKSRLKRLRTAQESLEQALRRKRPGAAKPASDARKGRKWPSRPIPHRPWPKAGKQDVTQNSDCTRLGAAIPRDGGLLPQDGG